MRRAWEGGSAWGPHVWAVVSLRFIGVVRPPAVVIGDDNWRRGCGIRTECKAGAAGYFVGEVVDINTERRVVVGYNDMFMALAIARGFRGDRGVYEDRELYI